MPMSDEQLQQEKLLAIEEYLAAKERLVTIKKRLEDFRTAAFLAANAIAPGSIKRGVNFGRLLNGAELSNLVEDYFDTSEKITELERYLSARGHNIL